MNIRSSSYRAAWTLAFTVLAAPTFAKDSGFFVGATLGQSKYETDAFDFSDPTIVSSSVDDKDLSLGIVAGWRFMKYLGIEAGFHEFGDLEVNALVQVPAAPPDPAVGQLQNLNVSARGASLSLVGTLPLGEKWELFAKVGALRGETKIDVLVNQTTAALVGFAEVKAKTTEVLYSAGAGYEFADQFFVRLEWLQISNMGDEDEIGLEVDVSNINLGFMYRF